METMTHEQWLQKPAEYRGIVNGVPYVLQLDRETGATVSAPVRLDELRAADYRREGYTVAFRSGVVYLFRCWWDGPQLWAQANDNGRWMERPNGWERVEGRPDLLADIEATRAVCYCSSLPNGNCDFCSQTRLAPTDA